MTFKSIDWDGKKITKPGLYAKLSLDLYHAPNICDGISLSSSQIRRLNPDIGSPKHFWAYWHENPQHIVMPDSRAFIVGRAVHHLLLGEPFFAKLFAVQPDEYINANDGEVKPWNNNAKYCRSWHEERKREGRTVLTAKEVDQIKGISVEVGHHPHARDFLSGAIERSFFWKDKATGLWLKWRPDAIPNDSMDFADLKTTISVQWSDLMRTTRDFAYYQQAALGRTACREVLGRDMTTYTFLFVEKTYPHAVRDVRIDESDMDRGERMNRACIRNFVECRKAGHWPGPGGGNEGNERLGLSDGARQSIDARLKMEGLADGQD